MTELELRCTGCKSLCADMDTLKVHERFCKKRIKILNRSRDTGIAKIAKRIGTCINALAAQCAACGKYSRRQKRCLEGVW